MKTENEKLQAKLKRTEATLARIKAEALISAEAHIAASNLVVELKAKLDKTEATDKHNYIMFTELESKLEHLEKHGVEIHNLITTIIASNDDNEECIVVHVLAKAIRNLSDCVAGVK